jgi:hypothetical protein
MEARELAARLDTWVGRGAPPPSRPPARGKRAKKGNRRLAAAALLAALASGWLVLARHHGSSAAPLPVDPQLAAPSTVAPAIDTSELRGYLDPGAVCRDEVAAVPSVSCTLGRVEIDAELVDRAAASQVYVSRSGARIAPRHGPPACARGAVDERAWSRSGAPAIAVGRYECRVEAGRAAIWWFDEHGIVVHAVSPDGNLSSLFSWWVTHVEQ